MNIIFEPPATYSGRKIRNVYLGNQLGPRLLIEQHVAGSKEYDVVDQFYRTTNSAYPTQVREVLASRLTLKDAKAFAAKTLLERAKQNNAG